VADSAPITRSTGGLDFVLGQTTVKVIPYMPRDIWNHVVTTPLQVLSNGVLLTNWSAAYGYVQAEDASGNWDFFARHRSLDPRYVWKLDADFEPESDFSATNLLTLGLPSPGNTIATNLMNVPVTILWDGQWLDANALTDRRDLALRYVCVTDDQGHKALQSSGSWNQHRFR
jgi:hypothetical protein